MKAFAKNFLNGIVTVVPIILVIYVVIKVFEFLDNILGQAFRSVMQEDYVPGIGLLGSILLITLLGWLSKQYISGKVVELLDRLLDRIPLVKSLYSIIKDTLQSFAGDKKSFSKVALVYIPGTNMKAIGFVTSESVDSIAEPLTEHIAVYVPQTFQVAGMTFLVPIEDVEILDMKAEDAMKFVLSGGMSVKPNHLKGEGKENA
ncbi:DUF502 domain-containing protein [Pseudalkalibacillus berkeleyi]|uniref:DUF502 domain-containing protein n=1 Tax=Pseudalkalibacillus berkeleyi TaxID=1069813 RepID=A0ABS9GZV3_9BACL|nr:DUF502 domain-containing protein [Pseudalkalibacillus berkeleyi]MCF6137356.1 DUF502 domain-containing protein [Pseudalkalibacillus berkeleyi]